MVQWFNENHQENFVQVPTRISPLYYEIFHKVDYVKKSFLSNIVSIVDDDDNINIVLFHCIVIYTSMHCIFLSSSWFVYFQSIQLFFFVQFCRISTVCMCPCEWCISRCYIYIYKSSSTGGQTMAMVNRAFENSSIIILLKLSENENILYGSIVL